MPPSFSEFSDSRFPRRPRLLDSLGRMQTLAQGPESFACHRTGKGVLLLGLGPDPETAAQLCGDDVIWVECPAFMKAMEHRGTGWEARIPDRWRAVTPSEAVKEADKRRIVLYRQNPRLFPEFWGPLWGRIQAALLGAAPPASRSSVLLPGDDTMLLARELREAFVETGYAVHVIPARDPAALTDFLRRERPSLFFSVNLRGLDAEGAAFHLLRGCGVPVAIWFVDNPWHILSSLRLPWWREAVLFCTDAAFLPDLRRAGAARAEHLPLAVAPHMWRTLEQSTPAPLFRNRVLFVGRSSFPTRDAFFSATEASPELLREALELLAHDGRPHFAWWLERAGVTPWPGHAVRRAGYGAEQCAATNRGRWLRAAAACGLTVYGDTGWRDYLPSVNLDLRPPVDYYTTLPSLYAAAPCTLNVTSLLLPAGLTQRHFDVWAAGGLLLTDTTLGLRIFPSELTREIALAAPADLAPRLDRLERESTLRADLTTAWRAHLSAHHTYTHRVRSLLSHMGLQ